MQENSELELEILLNCYFDFESQTKKYMTIVCFFYYITLYNKCVTWLFMKQILKNLFWYLPFYPYYN